MSTIHSSDDSGAEGSSSHGTNGTRTPKTPAPGWLFALEILYLVVLIGVGLAYFHASAFRRFLPNPAGPIPLAIPWWGALGGITISLTGIFRNANKWDSSYQLWHIARPVLGAVVGSVAYLIFIVVIRTTGVSVTMHSPPTGAVFDLVAFIAGYREENFRELLKRASDTLFASTRDQKSQDTGPTKEG